MAEKPITVATDEAINSFTDSRQHRLAASFRRWNHIPGPREHEQMRPESLRLP